MLEERIHVRNLIQRASETGGGETLRRRFLRLKAKGAQATRRS